MEWVECQYTLHSNAGCIDALGDAKPSCDVYWCPGWWYPPPVHDSLDNILHNIGAADFHVMYKPFKNIIKYTSNDNNRSSKQ